MGFLTIISPLENTLHSMKHNRNKNEEKNFSSIFRIFWKFFFDWFCSTKSQFFANLFWKVPKISTSKHPMVKQKNWPLYYTPVSSHLKWFDNRMKIDLCASWNVPDPPLNAASAPLVFKLASTLWVTKNETWKVAIHKKDETLNRSKCFKSASFFEPKSRAEILKFDVFLTSK